MDQMADEFDQYASYEAMADEDPSFVPPVDPESAEAQEYGLDAQSQAEYEQYQQQRFLAQQQQLAAASQKNTASSQSNAASSRGTGNYGSEQLSPEEKQAQAQRLLAGLNPQQAQAVQYQGPALLIAAGAGSGKTRVLTRRIAWVMSQWNAWPSQILAITFTNKAAAEMRERLTKLVGSQRAERLWVSTFHSACVRILRRFPHEAGLKSNFTIYDQQDQLRLLKLIETDFNIDVKKYKPRQFSSKISDWKNSLQGAQEVLQTLAPSFTPGVAGTHITGHEKQPELEAMVYGEYQYRLAAANAVDFDDLIMKTVELLNTSQEAADFYHKRLHYVLVDEYQDTNRAQYEFLRLIAGYEGFAVKRPAWISVVGDSDQSIYAFRGADISNILDFENDFPHAKTILLEQNYRSTQNILDAANAVIAKNEGRKPKKLWTSEGSGDKIIGYAADDARGEARFVTEEIAHIRTEENIAYSDVAIMYRTNAQSRLMEEQLVAAGIPYLIVGGTRFYERAEIKNALAYLHALLNPADDISLRRILNEPRRGIGAKTELDVANFAQAHSMSFWEALSHLDEIGLSAAPVKHLRQFVDLMQSMMDSVTGDGVLPSTAIHVMLENSGLVAQYRASQDVEDQSRLENLGQLETVAKEYEANEVNPTLDGFLEQTALVADSDQLPDADSGRVTLMTLHTAKGLEYPVVFLTGMEEGTFPSARAMAGDNDAPDASTNQLEEERRLAYVGITRARKRLYITRAGIRSQWGQAQEMPPSRFLDEIPAQLIDWRREFTATENVRSNGGWGSNNFGDDFDSDFSATSAFGTDEEGFSYGGRSSFGSRYSRSYGSGSFGARSSFGSRGSYGANDFDDSDDYSSSGSSYGSGSRRSGSRSSSSYGSSSRSSSYGSGSSSYRSRSSIYGSSSRGSYGSNSYGSRFEEKSKIHYSHKPVEKKTATAASGSTYSISDFAVGDKVSHDKYGLGTVTEVFDKGANSILVVDFKSEGVKRLLLRMAPVEKL